MSTRSKVVLELGAIATLTAIFLVLFPRRNPLLDVALAGFALLCIALSAPYTKNVIWAATTVPVRENRTAKCFAVTLWITVPVALLFLFIGSIAAYRIGGWPGVTARILNWRILAAFGAYLPWALMQQTLLQFYLLGRLLVLLPKQFQFLAFALIGICFGLVHLPDIWTALATVAAGTVWSLIYYRYRALLPLAFSHAALGSAFYYGLFGQDLAAEWRALVGKTF
ncbi:MAG TPA: CPBP family glutamic-type intramembrane protease [Patescibacteria group bacterium]|nr:CPBP family glutamic-type intramembrane protease [Patescibacteria group bacterium]